MMDTKVLTHSQLQKTILTFQEYVDKIEKDNHLLELAEDLPNPVDPDAIRWDLDKVRTVLKISTLNDSEDLQEILSFLDQTEYGWNGRKYHFYNSCLAYNEECRHYYRISSEDSEEVVRDIMNIFTNKQCGAITSYLFAYSLSALFNSRLKKENKFAPHFLQIACRQNSNIYRLIESIIRICDVNVGIHDNCEHHQPFAGCYHEPIIIYPSPTTKSPLDQLLYYRDIPVIVDGFENEQAYDKLIRDVSNIAGRTKRLDLKARFSVSPVFICPIIHSQFKNVLSIDLADFDIDETHVRLIEDYARCFASWVYLLVVNVDNYFGVNQISNITQRDRMARDLQRSNVPKNEWPMFPELQDRIRLLRRYNAKILPESRESIGCLCYFFVKFMSVFRNTLSLPEGENSNTMNESETHNLKDIVEKLPEFCSNEIIYLYSKYSQLTPDTVSVLSKSKSAGEMKRLQRDGERYARDIVKYYQSYAVSIRITEAEYREDRYIFNVKLQPGTVQNLIHRYADDVRQLLELKVFIPVIEDNSIMLVVSKNEIENNSLIKILDGDDFKNSDMEIPYAVGYDMLGRMVISDISEFPHLLIGGASNSGKSSAIHSIIMSIVYKQPADKVKLLMIDFGASGLKMFNSIPHLLTPVISKSEVEKSRQSLIWLQSIMEDRLKRKDSSSVADFQKIYKRWSSIVCIIDEFPAFIRYLTDGKYNKNDYMLIVDILERARKVKIHLILAAQDSSKENIKIKKTNLGAAIAFRCTNRYDSQSIIGTSDAMHLSGKGSMYFFSYQHSEPQRLQGSFMPPLEIGEILSHMEGKYKSSLIQYEPLRFDLDPCEIQPSPVQKPNFFIENGVDESLLVEIIKFAFEKGEISNNQLKKEFNIGYDVAKRHMEFLEKLDFISTLTAKKKREIKPKTVTEISEEVLLLMEKHGFNKAAIENFFSISL